MVLHVASIQSDSITMRRLKLYLRVCEQMVCDMGLLLQVYSAFRGNGGERRLKQEVAGAMAQHAVTRGSSRV